MHVLHVFESFPSITEKWAFDLICASADVDATVTATKWLRSSLNDDRIEYAITPLVYVSPAQHLWERGWNSVLRRIEPRLQREVLVRRSSVYGPVDLVHAHFGPLGWRSLGLVKRIDVPLIVSFYGYDLVQLAHIWPWPERYKELFSRGAGFLVEGPFAAGLLQGLGCSPDKIHICPLGVRAPTSPALSARTPRYFVQAASLVEKKGHSITLTAFADVHQEFPDARLSFVGDGPLRDVLARQAALLGLNDAVTFISQVTPDQLPSVLSGYDVFVQPSRHVDDGNCEGGFPVTLLEAQRVGLPVLSTRHCDIPSAVADESSGILVAEDDPLALATGWRRFLEMAPEEFASYSEHAVKIVRDQFALGRTATAVTDVYRQLTRVGSLP